MIASWNATVVNIDSDLQVHTVLTNTVTIIHIIILTHIRSSDYNVVHTSVEKQIRLIRNTVCDSLELVVALGVERLDGLLDESSEVSGGLSFSLLQNKSPSQVSNGMLLETGKSRIQHGQNQLDDGLSMRSTSQESLDRQFLEPSVSLGLSVTSHNQHHLVGELEGGSLKLDTTRHNIETETKVNVQNMTLSIVHNVTIVPILELNKVGDDGVGSERLHKVVSGSLELDRILRSVLGGEILVQTVDGLSTQHISRDGVGENVNDTTTGCRGGDSVGEDVQIHSVRVENGTEDGNDLQSQHILSTVITDLENGRLPLLDGGGQLVAVLVDILVIVTNSSYFSSDLESGHVRSLGVRLQRSSTLSVNVNDGSVGVGGQIDTNVDLDLVDLLIDLGLLLSLSLFDVGLELSGNVRDLGKEAKLSFIEGLLLGVERVDHSLNDVIKSWLHGVGDSRVLILVGVGHNIPDNLVGKQLRQLGSLQNVPLYIASLVVSQ
jgi:exonuclease VII small subunit